MPLAAPGIQLLGDGFLPLFDDPPITETAAAAVQWAKAYFDYAKAGNVTPEPYREKVLADALTVAFNPELGRTPPGGGRTLFINALSVFWIGVPATVPPGIVNIYAPSGSIDSDVSNDANAEEQARALADIIHQFTIGSFLVTPFAPPNTPVPIS